MQSPQSPDLNLRLFQPLVRYVTDYYGRAEMERIATSSGLTLGDLDGTTRWASTEQIETMLLGIRKLMIDDRKFLEACSYELEEPRGPIRMLVGALNPTAAYEIGAKIMRTFSAISQFDVERIQRGEVRIRYTTTKRESRLLCLTRQAQIEGMPKLWGLPPAHLTEESCVAHGDECCSYHLRLYEARRWVPAMIGLAAGIAGVSLLYAADRAVSPAWALLACLLGHLWDQRQAMIANRRTQESINATFLQMVRDDSNARRELFELTQRQKTWGHLMEDEVVDKVELLNQLVAEVEQLQPNPVVQLKRDSTRFENPLATIRTGLAQLRDISPTEAQPTVDRLSQTVVVLDRKLRTIARLANSAPGLVSLCSRTVPVAPLADELRNRLKALVRGKDVRVSVFTVRDAPDQITIDTVLFNRIIDNLLLNAAEFTERGSIVLEVGGTPDFLTVKISDTGGTLRDGEVGKIFRPVSRGPNGYGYGAGLSVVVQLLAAVGGKLDVMNHPGKGTTFWAHFPLSKQHATGASEGEATPLAEPEAAPTQQGDVVNQVVTIRKSEGG